MTELKEIYLCLNGEERGPFDPQKVEGMLQDGLVRLSDRAWRTGLADWDTLESVLRPAAAGPASEPATARQKAFLSYMNIAFSAGLTKEKAALLVNDAMENPGDPRRLAHWPEERLRLHPELYAEDVKAKKESRPKTFLERVQGEGADCFHDVSQAHCQVLVGYLDNKFPNWDARDSDAAWDYFFPALAEKFPQLVNKGWKGRLQYKGGPRVSDELTQKAPTKREVYRPKRPLVSPGLAFGVIVLALAGGAFLYSQRHPGALQKMADSARAAAQSAAASPAPAPASAKPAPEGGETVAKSESTEVPKESRRSAKPAKTSDAEIAMTTPPASGTADGSMSGAAMADGSMSSGSMAATPGAEAGSPPPLFTPPTAPGANNAAPPPSTSAFAPAPGPRTTAKIITPLTIKTTYGVVTIAPGTTLKILSKDGATIRLNYMNQMIAVPLAATDVEP